ncbi:hypothetical protein [Arenimonas daejeonensis]|uniref:hypothetical protein n=1 Tax=Arenimonas daejeonensis TaxID=370777 RepID=UPI0011BDE914|nr:hypothetical protein [Arenimonas daejeonensis]
MLKIRRLPRPLIRRWWPMATLVLLHLSMTATAQPMADPGDKTKAVQLKLESVDGEPGRWARIEARIPDKGRRYYVRGLDVMAPLSIQVAAERTDRPVDVSLHRHAWGQTATSGSTGETGLYRFDGRAHAQVGIRLTPTDGAAKVTLLVWQGDPVRADYASVIVPPAQDENPADAAGEASDTGGPAWTTYAMLAVLVVIAGLLAALLLRRGRGHAASLLFASGLAMALLFAVPAAPVQAADPPKDKNDESSDPKLKLPEEKPDASPAKPKPGDKPALPADTDKDKDAATDDYADRIAGMEQHVRDLHEQAVRDRAEVARLRLLVEEDRDSEPDPDNLPPMPLSCRPPTPGVSGDVIGANDHRWDDYEACQSCYAEPLAELEKQLELYERLRILYSSAKSDLSKMMAAGDMAPKPHYMVDSAWQAQKQKINVAFQQTQKAYDDKHLEFRDKLAGIVDAIGVCEARHNNNPMWRETTGRLFLETVSSSYRRND